MNKAIILDRDGTLNEDEKGFTHKLEDFKLFQNVIPALKILKEKFRFFIITNQSGVGRGYYSIDDVNIFNKKVVDVLKEEGIIIEEIFVCPHHPQEDCECRKPRPKFIEEIKKKYKIDLKRSYVIGDHEADVLLGKNAGAKSVLLLTGHGKKHLPEMKITPDHIAEDILDAANWIIEMENIRDQ